MVMTVEGSDGVDGAVVTDHAQTGDLQGLGGDDVALLGMDRAVDPLNWCMVHTGHPFMQRYLLYIRCGLL